MPMPSTRYRRCEIRRPRPSAAIVGLALAAATLLPVARATDADREWHYVVSPGDTLIGLTERLLQPPATWRKLQLRNRVADPLRLMPGRTLRIPVAWLRGDAAVAEIVHVQGAVQVRRDGAELPALSAGDRLRAGDAIRTGAQATLTLRLVDGSQLLVAPDSRVSIERLLVFQRAQLTETRLRLDEGGIDSRVAPAKAGTSRYEVRTPALDLGVRGTEFGVRYDAAGRIARSDVHAGRVAASSPRGQVLLDAGFGTVADAGGAVAPPRRLPGAPQLLGVAQRLERVPLRFSWTAVGGAQGYRAQVFADRAFDRLLLDGVFVEPGARWADLPDGRYVLRVRSLDDAGLEGAASAVDFVLKARPEPPFTSRPAAGERVYGDAANFGWTASPAAQRYRLQVAGNAGFDPLLIDEATISGTEFRAALAPGTYHWRVASIARGDDQGPFSDTLSFSQRRIPESPPLEAPDVGDQSLTLRWKAGEPGQSFQYQLAADPQFAAVLRDERTTEPRVTLPRPETGTYYLRVRTLDADGFAGPFGAAQQFEVKGAPWWNYLPLLLLLLVV